MTRERLDSLACAFSFTAPPEVRSRGYASGFIDGDKLVCCDVEGVFVLDLGTGKVVRRVPIAGGSNVRRVGDGYVVNVTDFVRHESAAPGGRLIHLPFDDVPASIVAYRGYLKSWSSRCEVAVFDAGTLEVRRWPTMKLVHAVHGYHPTIDWANRLVLVSDTAGHRHVVESIDGGHERRYVPYGDLAPQHFYVVGNGVASISSGYELVGYLAGWRTKLFPVAPAEGSIHPQVTRDGRGLRILMGNRTYDVELDFSTGELLTSLPASAGSQSLSRQLWHPRLDAVVLEDDTSDALCDLDGTIQVRLPPGARAKQWFDDGRALLVTHPSDAGPLQIDVWRFAEAHAS